MCEPTTLAYAAFALTAAGTLAQYQEGKNSATAQQQMIEDGIAKDRAATSRQYEEIAQVSQDQRQQRYAQMLIDDARLRAIGAESGLQGATQGRIEQSAQNTADTDIATLEANSQRQTQQAATQAISKSSQASAQLAGIRQPSALGAGLQIAGGAVGAYGKWDEANKAAQAQAAARLK